MASAVFTSGLMYSPGGGGTLNQGFRMAFNYTAVSAGRHDVAAGSVAAVVVSFGGVGKALGVIVQNSTDVDVSVKINASAVVFNLAPGGMLMQWAPKAPGTAPFAGVTFTPMVGPSVDGAVEYVVLGS
jgi:hypothetical protein